MTDRALLAVLGHPIAHSRSPSLHRAAYELLDLPWDYERVDVTSAGLRSFVAALGPSWRGLSLTMPLKRAVLPLLDERDELVRLIGVANTVLFDRGGGTVTVRGFNTDVDGVIDTLRGHDVEDALVLGAGATAASVLVALSRLGARRVRVGARAPERAGALRELAARVGVELTVAALGSAPVDRVLPLTVSTLPGGAAFELPLPALLPAHAVLLDVAYEPWPTPLAAAWLEAGGTVRSGLEMLVHQALRQVRIFVDGDPDRPLDREADILRAMRGSVGLSDG